MEPGEKIEWSALEYEEKEHNNDWFWALGIIVLAGGTTSIIYNNYFFAGLLILGGILLGFFAIKKPETVFYQLNEKGIQIKSRIYPYQEIKSFWVQKISLKDNLPEAFIFIKTKRIILPIISIPIDNEWANEIREIFLSNGVPEEKMKEPRSVEIMESLGF